MNHDGRLGRALELVDAAADAGADAIKLQHFDADLLMGPRAALADYQRQAGETDPREMLRRLQLPLDALGAVVARAHERGVHAIMTVFSTELVEAAASLPLDAFKSASPDIIHEPLLRAMWSTGRPLIVSTGASSVSEIDRATRWLTPATQEEEPRLALLQCVSAYPTPEEHAALRAIAALIRRYRIPVGYSDHTSGVETGGLAVAAGACLLEKHLTWDRAAPGPDHGASLDPHGFRAYVEGARRAFRMLGSVGKRVLDIERDVRRVSRQSLATTRAMAAGHVLRPEDLTVQRPGLGIPPWRLGDVIGSTLQHPVEAGEILAPHHLPTPEPVS